VAFDVDTVVPAPALSIASPTHFINHDAASISVLVGYSGMQANDTIDLHKVLTPGVSLLTTPHTVTAAEAAAHSVALDIATGAFGGDGSYDIAATETDASGNVGTSGSDTVIRDTVVPTVHIGLDPNVNTSVNASESGLTYHITYDNMQLGDVVQMKVNNVFVGPQHTVDQTDLTTNNDTVLISLSNADMGGDGLNKHILADVIDAAQNHGQSPVLTVGIDTSIPVPVINPTSAGNTMSSSSNDLDVLVNYTGMAVGDTITLSDGVNAVGSAHTVVASDLTSPNGILFDLARSDFHAGTGSYTIQATVTDSFQNSGTNSGFAVIIA
jgi:hypothetical protein